MKAKVTLRDISLIAIASAILIAIQVAMSPIPNIELVSLLVILYTIHFRYKALYIISVFVLVEGLIYGFGIWWYSYLYIWTVLFFLTLCFRQSTSPLLFAVVGAGFGLLFGTLSSIPYFFLQGAAGAIVYISSGVLFDLLHCAGNFVTILLLFKPLNTVFSKVLIGIRQSSPIPGSEPNR